MLSSPQLGVQPHRKRRRFIELEDEVADTSSLDGGEEKLRSLDSLASLALAQAGQKRTIDQVDSNGVEPRRKKRKRIIRILHGEEDLSPPCLWHEKLVPDTRRLINVFLDPVSLGALAVASSLDYKETRCSWGTVKERFPPRSPKVGAPPPEAQDAVYLKGRNLRARNLFLDSLHYGHIDLLLRMPWDRIMPWWLVDGPLVDAVLRYDAIPVFQLFTRSCGTLEKHGLHSFVTTAIRYSAIETFRHVFEFNRVWHEQKVGSRPVQCRDCGNDGHRSTAKQWAMLFYVRAVSAGRLDILRFFEQEVEVNAYVPPPPAAPSFSHLPPRQAPDCADADSRRDHRVEFAGNIRPHREPRGPPVGRV